MQRADEQRIRRNCDPAAHELLAHCAVVQKSSQQPRIDLARIAATGPAVERAGVRVVRHVGAMSGQKDETREVLRQRHCAQDRFRSRRACCKVQVGRKPRRGIVRSAM